jgi:hypothetical protein
MPGLQSVGSRRIRPDSSGFVRIRPDSSGFVRIRPAQSSGRAGLGRDQARRAARVDDERALREALANGGEHLGVDRDRRRVGELGVELDRGPGRRPSSKWGRG